MYLNGIITLCAGLALCHVWSWDEGGAFSLWFCLFQLGLGSSCPCLMTNRAYDDNPVNFVALQNRNVDDTDYSCTCDGDQP